MTLPIWLIVVLSILGIALVAFLIYMTIVASFVLQLFAEIFNGFYRR